MTECCLSATFPILPGPHVTTLLPTNYLCQNFIREVFRHLVHDQWLGFFLMCQSYNPHAGVGYLTNLSP